MVEANIGKQEHAISAETSTGHLNLISDAQIVKSVISYSDFRRIVPGTAYVSHFLSDPAYCRLTGHQSCVRTLRRYAGENFG
jgi:hypothetical protein